MTERGRRVVVVEDDACLREELLTGLVASGYIASGLGDGSTAALAATREPPDALVLDIEMPALDGLRLAQVMRALAPGTRLVVMSGHGYLRLAASDLLGPGIAILAKPFTFDDLLARLEAPL